MLLALLLNLSVFWCLILPSRAADLALAEDCVQSAQTTEHRQSTHSSISDSGERWPKARSKPETKATA